MAGITDVAKHIDRSILSMSKLIDLMTSFFRVRVALNLEVN